MFTSLGRLLPPSLLFRSFLLITLAALPNISSGQEQYSHSIAEYIQVVGSNAVNGSIIEFSNGVYQAAQVPFSEQVVGVASTSPSVVFGFTDVSSNIGLVRRGVTQVLVKGDITAGDFIASSDESGIGRRADRAGFTIGRAIESAAGDDVHLVMADIYPRFTWPAGSGITIGSLVSNPGEALGNLPTPVRYAVSGLVVLISIIAAYIMYSFMSQSTMTAMGRNPLARRSILVLASQQTVGAGVLVIAGFILAYLITAI